MPIGPITLYGSPNWRGRRIGLLGGSFNPAHAGHRHISLTALKRLKLDAVWWLVSPQNPLKSARDMAPQRIRLKQAALVEAHPRIIATDIESVLGTRFTVDTVTLLMRRFRGTQFIWLMGADNLAGFHRWKDWQKIVKALPMAIMLRPGYAQARWSAPSLARVSGARHREAEAANWTMWRKPGFVLLSLPMNGTSATALRASNPDWAKQLS
jgi:nicotinate-nucleotide adenylyltransferase